MTKIFNVSKLKYFRSSLRKNMTEFERKLWSKLRKKQFLNLRFHRQYSIGKYILDFYCPDRKIAIELDGSHHLEIDIKANDDERTRFLESLGIQVLRFQNQEVNRIQNVLDTIERNCYPPFIKQIRCKAPEF